MALDTKDWNERDNNAVVVANNRFVIGHLPNSLSGHLEPSIGAIRNILVHIHTCPCRKMLPCAGTWHLFETRCLLALWLNLHPAYKPGRRLFKEGIYLSEYSTVYMYVHVCML